jgi:hypothetical protein
VESGYYISSLLSVDLDQISKLLKQVLFQHLEELDIPGAFISFQLFHIDPQPGEYFGLHEFILGEVVEIEGPFVLLFHAGEVDAD